MAIATIDVASEGGAAHTEVVRPQVEQLQDRRLEWWGEDPPAALATAAGVLDATDEQLEALDRSTVIAAADDHRLRVVTGTAAPALVYAANQGGIEVWSTHATAASVIATGTAHLNPARVAEILGVGACVGAHAHLTGVRSISVATVIDNGAERGYYARTERWARVERPLQAAEDALLATLDGRLKGSQHPYVALTAGRDSAVAAAALARLGRPFATFTWGDEAWGEVVEARRRAQILDVPHQANDADYRDGIAALERGLAEVRWTEGIAHLAGWGAPRWPTDMSAIVTGAGAEVGRAYYYAWCVRTRSEPAPRHLARILGAHTRLGHASHDAQATLRNTLEAWFERAPRRGWEALDVFYTEERMGRWGHAHLSRTQAPWVTAFTVPDVARALLSIPREDRLRMAFHEHMTAGLGFTLPAVPAQRPGGPAIARRAYQTLNRIRASRQPAQPWFLNHLWDTRPDLHDHVDDALSHPLLTGALGEDWAIKTRAGLRRGERFPTERALAAAGLAVYAQAAEAIQAEP